MTEAKGDGKAEVKAADSFTFFFGEDSVFSNWYPCTFILPHPDDPGEAVTYNCVEQRMMHVKACQFGDAKSAAAIMRSEKPRYQKQVGRRVTGFDADVWDAMSMGVVTDALHAKFSQNSDLKTQLLANRNYVEASPYDCIWGIGLAATDKRALDRTQWRGENRLGQCLDAVRARLATRRRGPLEVLRTT